MLSVIIDVTEFDMIELRGKIRMLWNTFVISLNYIN